MNNNQIRNGSTKYVGIVTQSGKTLYCQENNDSYWVINGHWYLHKNGMIEDGKNDSFIKYKVVLNDMDEMEYNQACDLIEKYIECENEWKGITLEKYEQTLHKNACDSLKRLNTDRILSLVQEERLEENKNLRQLLIYILINNSNRTLNEKIIQTLKDYEK